MRYFIRLSIGATIILLIFVLCFRFSDNAQAKQKVVTMPSADIWPFLKAGPGLIGPAVDWGSAAPNFAAYKAALDAEDWYRHGRPFMPVFGYNEAKQILIPYNLIGKVAQKPWAYPEGAIVMAFSRDAVVKASSDTKEQIKTFEKRIRKLENTVAKIVSKCCKEAEDKG